MNQVDSEAKYDITDMNQQVFDIVNEMNEQINGGGDIDESILCDRQNIHSIHDSSNSNLLYERNSEMN